MSLTIKKGNLMSNVSSKRILVVDDDDDVRNFLSTALEDAGFQVETACDGFEAMEKVKAKAPDLISLDLVMPKYSGKKFYRNLQKEKDLSRIPVLIVTGHAHDELGKVDFDELTMQGPGVYLEKPVKPTNYVEKICEILKIDVPDMNNSSDKEAEKLKKELQDKMDNSDLDTLQKALDALNQKK